MAIDYESITRDWYERGVKGGNGEVLFGRLSEQIQWWCFGPPLFMSNGYYEGREGVKCFFSNLEKTLTVNMMQDFTPSEFHVAQNLVFVFGLETGVVKQSGLLQTGLKFDNYFAHTLSYEGDKICRFRVNYSVAPQGSVHVKPFNR